MSTLIQLIDADKHIGRKQLFEKASFVIQSGDHIGVIGPNGAGKTTLFKILVGLETLHDGEMVFAKKTKIGYLDQESTWSDKITAEEYLEQSCQLPIWELKNLGLSLGLSEKHFNSPLQSLSGGFRMRMKLLYMIGQEPNCMLLDEPTNFLDLESMFVLEEFLKKTKSAFLVISHDREFLNRVTSVTLEISNRKITRYTGSVEAYLEFKAQDQILREKKSAKEQAKREEVEDFANRFRAKASKAKQVKSRLKQLDKMENTTLDMATARAAISIPKPTHTGKETLHIEKAVLGYPEKTVLTGVDFRLMRGDHLAVVGFNGAGKTTLLKSLAAEIPLLDGSIKIGYEVSFGYYAQHVPEKLALDSTVFEALCLTAHHQVSEQEIKDIAGALLFKGDDINKKIGILSGGEKSRVAIGQILLKKAPCLLLDEPTNHLDFDTVESLTKALQRYPGTIVVVSHDRHFVSKIASKILEIKDGAAHFYPGSYEEYLWSVENGILSSRQDADTGSDKNHKSEKSKPKPASGMSLGKLSKAISDAEKKVNRIQRQLAKIEKTLINADSTDAQALSTEYAQLKAELTLTESQWMSFQESYEENKKR